MGVEILAISKAQPVACRGDDDCDDDHVFVGTIRKGKDGLKTGCYVKGKGGRMIGFPAGTYIGYDDFRKQLSLLGLGVLPSDVWENPRRFRGKPFAELIDLPDAVGPIIGPKTSAKLYADFEEFASRAKKHFLEPAPTVAPPPKKMKGGRKGSHINRLGAANAEDFARAIGGTVTSNGENDLSWMWEVYSDFRRAFKLASDGGFVAIC